MLKKYDESILMELIEEGYELERMSLEFEIPIEELQKLQLNMKRKKLDDFNSRRTFNRIETFSKMEEMRRKYLMLIEDDNKLPSSESVRRLSKEENKMVESIIEESRKLLELAKKNNSLDKIQLNIFFSNIKKIKKLPLTLSQIEQLKDIINDKIFLSITNKSTRPIYNEYKKMIMDKFFQSIDELYSKTKTLEQLKEIQKKLSGTYDIPFKLPIESRKRKIENQITKIIQENAMNNIEKRCSPDILSIIKELASGTCDIKKANEIIDLEVEKMQEQSGKTRFSLTEEQNKGRIFTQLKTIIRENFEKYPIDDPKKVSNQMMKLFGCKIEETIPCIMDNMLGRNEFEKTNKFVDEISKSFSDYKPVRILRRKVKTAEIGYIIGKGLRLQGTKEEEKKYIDLIEGGLEKYQLDPNSIIIGISKSGRKITLADVMPVSRVK